MSTEQPSTWQRIKRAGKGFLNGAVSSLPMTMLYTGGAFGLSAVMQSQLGVDPLGVTTQGTDMLAARFVGAAAIGSTLSGAFKAYNEYNAEEPATSATPVKYQERRQGHSRGRSHDVSMNDVAPPMLGGYQGGSTGRQSARS